MPLPVRQTSPARVAVVTAGLAVGGAVAGGVSGALALQIVFAISGDPLGLADGFELAFAALTGAFIGFFLAPSVGWLLLRRVPLGRAFGGLVLGTVLGGLAGWFLPGNDDLMTQPVLAACAGLLIAALLMRLMWRERRPPNGVFQDSSRSAEQRVRSWNHEPSTHTGDMIESHR